MKTISQQQPINILKPFKKGPLSYVLIGQNLISVIFHVFDKLTKVCFAFCNSVSSFHFGKQCRARKYRLILFLFKAELGCIEG